MRGKAVEATLLERTSFEDARFLTQFVSDTGKIYPKRRLGVSAKAQRKISRAIKTARQMGILPYTSRLPQFQRSNNML
ncbi:putative mitochondrial ribosomal protein S18 [Ostreococcus tauri]|nr:putative mitochondrial ribosomal protein S18 [Ostreococcus tauri]